MRNLRIPLRWVRRAMQMVSLAVFVFLVVGAPLLAISWLPSQLFSRLDPLVGLTAIVASRTLVAYAALGLGTAALTVVAGRAWCGWLCPLGTLLDIVPAGTSRLARPSAPLRFGKYVSFAVVTGAAVAGTLAMMILDPVTIAMRPLQEIAMPMFGSNAVGISAGTFLSRDAIGFVAYLSLVPLTIVLALNALGRRFWCRSLCPLGGMLATLSMPAVFKRVVDEETCTKCATCSRQCPTSAIVPKRGFASSPGDCIACGSCVEACPEHAITFAFTMPEAPAYAPERRQAIASLSATAASVGAVLAVPHVGGDDEVLRPPSTTEERLAERCVRCGACYSACPTGELRPSTSITTASGLWTPMLDERPGHCSLNCNRCAEVCPTDALHTFTVSEARQLGLGGHAEVDRDRCLAWSRGKDCLACAKVCPIAGSLGSVHVTVPTRFGPKETKAPVIDTDLCVACGQCSKACPLWPPAIALTEV